jgi:hypothetical protein
VISAGHQTSLDPLKWLFAWADTLPLNITVAILENDFFPKWHNVLMQWLCSGTADYSHVMQWFSAWRNLFPQVILSHERIQIQFKQGQDVMNQTLAGGVPLAPSNTASHTVPRSTAPTRRPVSSTALSASRARGLVDDGSLTLKDAAAQFVSDRTSLTSVFFVVF